MCNSFLYNNIAQNKTNKELFQSKPSNSLVIRAARRERCVWLPSDTGDDAHSSHILGDCPALSMHPVTGFVIITGTSNSFIFVKLVIHSFALITCDKSKGW